MTINSGVIKTGTILDRFIEENIGELNLVKKEQSLKEIQMVIKKHLVNRPSFIDALFVQKKKGKLALIAEIKKRSPTVGELSQARDIIGQARCYEVNGATAISVLTQPYQFQGKLNDLTTVVLNVSVPVLRKDFLFDPFHLYEAKLEGASAVLLIAMILEGNLLKELLAITAEIGLDALVEVHTEKELEKSISAGAKIIGVNARDLRTMRVDLNIFKRIIPQIPKEIIRVAESGIETKEHALFAKEAGADAILVGTSLMKSKNPAEKTKELLL